MIFLSELLYCVIIVSLYTDLTLDGIQLIEFHDGYFHSIFYWSNNGIDPSKNEVIHISQKFFHGNPYHGNPYN